MSISKLQEKLADYWGDHQGVASYVDGRFIAGEGDIITVKKAHDGTDLFSYRDAGAALLPVLKTATGRAQTQWWALTAQARGRIMYNIGAEIRKEADNLAEIEALYANKPVRDAKGEVQKVAEMFEYYAGWADKLHGEVIPVPTTHLNYVTYEPLGTVLQITPWNAPIFTCGWQIAPAIAAGNAVILKPSEMTPLTSLIVAVLAERAGAPKGLINVIAGYGHTIGQQLIAEAPIRKVVFVGSPATGKLIAVAAAQRGIPAVLELGGKSANIVFEDADWDKALRGAQGAIFGGAGQSCVSGSRLLVQESIYEKFVADMAEAAKKFRVGNPEEPETQIGPIHNEKQYRHVCSMLDKAHAEGAKVAGQNAIPVPDSEGYYINPTILKGNNQMFVAQEEIFGPVVIAIPFKDEEEAIRIANESRFGLAGAVWTNNVGRAHRVARQIKAGTFWINGYKTINVASPFGGYGESGYGRSSGLEALREYSEVKSVWVETAADPLVNFGYGAQEK
ncbi:aldehyde dehydrogenase family protein [Erwinia sp. E_sp_B04_7]|uniref:aldehyde dehydrogenase family protein n=1 Tax=unclassified Erwinia TaxID=2622719 RepID=UPI0030CB60C6